MQFSDLKNSCYFQRSMKKKMKNSYIIKTDISRKLWHGSFSNFEIEVSIYKICQLSLLITFFRIYDSFRDISVVKASWSSRAGPGRFMTEMRLGGENKLFFVYEPYS